MVTFAKGYTPETLGISAFRFFPPALFVQNTDF